MTGVEAGGYNDAQSNRERAKCGAEMYLPGTVPYYLIRVMPAEGAFAAVFSLQRYAFAPDRPSGTIFFFFRRNML